MYHITEDGPKKCVAKVKECKYGAHFNDKKSAEASYANSLESLKLDVVRIRKRRTGSSVQEKRTSTSSAQEILGEDLVSLLTEKEELQGEKLWRYCVEQKIVSETNQSGFVLRKLIDHPEGMCRKCLSELAQNERGSVIGQGGTREVATLRDRGVNIPKDIKKDCPVHGAKKPFDKIELPAVTSVSFKRKTFSRKERERIVEALGGETDSISGSCSEKLEVDHRVPVQRQKMEGRSEDIDVMNVSMEELRQNFQLLTRKNNLIKDRACSACVLEEKKPLSIDGVVGISYPNGDNTYVSGKNDCQSCPFAYPEKFGLPLSISIKS